MSLKINTLADTSLDEIVDCLVSSFKGYFVEMPSDVAFWRQRFFQNGVDKTLSWGVFDQERLVAFVVNAIESLDGITTMYNAGTGVLESLRGQKLVDQMYDFGLKNAKQRGVKKCILEVIAENIPAIKVYERIGYIRKRQLKSFAGDIVKNSSVNIRPISIDELDLSARDASYVWDQKSFVINRMNDLMGMEIMDQRNEKLGIAILNSTGKVIRVETYSNEWNEMFKGLSQRFANLKLSNVDDSRKELLKYLTNANFTNTINQYEMELTI